MSIRDLESKYKNSLLKAFDVAECLNICLSQAYKLMQKGEIPTIRIGRSVRVCESDLEAFIQKRRVGCEESSHIYKI